MTTTGMNPATAALSAASSGAAAFGRGNLEAVAQSAQAYLAGMQDLGRQYAAVMLGLTRHAFEDAKAFGGAKSPQEAVALQAGLIRASVGRALGEGANLQRAALALTERVQAPLIQSATAAFERTTFARAA